MEYVTQLIAQVSRPDHNSNEKLQEYNESKLKHHAQRQHYQKCEKDLPPPPCSTTEVIVSIISGARVQISSSPSIAPSTIIAQTQDRIAQLDKKEPSTNVANKSHGSCIDQQQIVKIEKVNKRNSSKAAIPTIDNDLRGCDTSTLHSIQTKQTDLGRDDTSQTATVRTDNDGRNNITPTMTSPTILSHSGGVRRGGKFSRMRRFIRKRFLSCVQ